MLIVLIYYVSLLHENKKEKDIINQIIQYHEQNKPHLWKGVIGKRPPIY